MVSLDSIFDFRTEKGHMDAATRLQYAFYHYYCYTNIYSDRIATYEKRSIDALTYLPAAQLYSLSCAPDKLWSTRPGRPDKQGTWFFL